MSLGWVSLRCHCLRASTVFAVLFFLTSLFIVRTCHSESGLIFDGSDDYCEITADSSLNISDAITIEAWVRWGGPTGLRNTQIILNHDFIAYQIGVGGVLDTGHFVWFLDDVTSGAPVLGGSWRDGGIIQQDEWTHVAVVFGGTSVQSYINGVVTGDFLTLGDISVRNNHVRIGARGVGAASSFFKGGIDEVRLWNVGRTSSEISSNMNRRLSGDEAGLVAQFSFEEGEGQYAGDSSPNENHARLGLTVGPDNQDPTWGFSDVIPRPLSMENWAFYR